jgi:hypothetical protein
MEAPAGCPFDFTGWNPCCQYLQDLAAGFGFRWWNQQQVIGVKVEERPDAVIAFRSMRVPNSRDAGTDQHQILIGFALVQPQKLTKREPISFFNSIPYAAAESPEPFLGVADSDPTVEKSVLSICFVISS